MPIYICMYIHIYIYTHIHITSAYAEAYGIDAAGWMEEGAP